MVTKISWDEIEKAVEDIAQQIKQAAFEADYIIGIASGGIVPLGLLAKKMDIKNVLTVTARSYEEYKGTKQSELFVSYLPEVDLRGKRILLVDELADTGKTLKKISVVMLEKYQPKELKTVTLAMNTENCKFLPDFTSILVKHWLIAPWDKEEFPQHF